MFRWFPVHYFALCSAMTSPVLTSNSTRPCRERGIRVTYLWTSTRKPVTGYPFRFHKENKKKWMRNVRHFAKALHGCDYVLLAGTIRHISDVNYLWRRRTVATTAIVWSPSLVITPRVSSPRCRSLRHIQRKDCSFPSKWFDTSQKERFTSANHNPSRRKMRHSERSGTRSQFLSCSWPSSSLDQIWVQDSWRKKQFLWLCLDLREKVDNEARVLASNPDAKCPRDGTGRDARDHITCTCTMFEVWLTHPLHSQLAHSTCSTPSLALTQRVRVRSRSICENGVWRLPDLPVEKSSSSKDLERWAAGGADRQGSFQDTWFCGNRVASRSLVLLLQRNSDVGFEQMLQLR